MPDPTERLAAVLREHRCIVSAQGVAFCFCGRWDESHATSYDTHVATALLNEEPPVVVPFEEAVTWLEEVAPMLHDQRARLAAVARAQRPAEGP